VQTNNAIGFLRDFFRGADVVDVRVCVRDVEDCDFLRGQFLEDALRFITGIDDNSFSGFRIRNDGTVALEGAHGKSLD
jgi:hypothetical protein